jgi:Family of unknown function (DUF6279)
MWLWFQLFCLNPIEFLLSMVKSGGAFARVKTPRWTTALLLTVVLLLGACSILQFVYNQAPKYFMWRSNRAFHYNSQQYDMAKGFMYNWFDWQKHEQLPVMAVFFKRAQSEILVDMSPALACQRRDEMEGWARSGIDQAVPMVTQLMLTLQPSQINHLSDFFDEQNEDYQDKYLPADPQERLDRATDFVIKWSGLIYGRMSDQQRLQLRTDIAKLPFDAAVILKQFQRFQTSYLALLRESQRQKWTQAQLQPRLRALLFDMLDPVDPALRADLRSWIAAGCQLTSGYHHRTTPSQRKAAAEQLKVWEQDFRELAAEP